MIRRYNALVLGVTALIGIMLCGATLYNEPVVGDLTRLGGYSENDFGWREPQQIFAPALADDGRLDSPYDVVIVGDSFSSRTTPDRQTPLGGFWTDFLAEKTGLSVGVFDLDRTPVHKVIGSDGFRSRPPRLVIYQTVERALSIRFANDGAGCGVDAVSGGFTGLRRRGVNPIDVLRDTTAGLSDKRFNSTVDQLTKSLRRLMDRPDGTPVVLAQLSAPHLFSNRRSSEILLISDDLSKKNWSSEQIDRFRCALRRYQEIAEQNGITKFVALVVPDKSSVYVDFLPPQFRQPEICPVLARDPGLSLVCLGAPLRAAVKSLAPDVYLPNDTHWGSVGANIGAERMAAFLAR